MHQYRRYAQQLEALAKLSITQASLVSTERVERALNGEASETLYAKVPTDVLRRAGAFFTPPAMAERLVKRVSRQLAGGARVLDPACGAGDLLLACARLLPIERTLSATLALWGRRLSGFDIHREFVLATKARLALLAIARGARVDGNEDILGDIEQLFPGIHQQDFLDVPKLPTRVDVVVMNPPFQRKDAPAGTTWGRGLVTYAAVFVEKVLSVAGSSTLVALLPDVLRSGSNYAEWRATVTQTVRPKSVEPLGVFSDRADVDVFVVTLERKQLKAKGSRTTWLPTAVRAPGATSTLETICDVRVGPVVPFRDPEKGDARLYITTATLPPWSTATPVARRKYSGEVFAPPFVAVRRTSRPSDPQRAIGTIVKADEPVAVENHVLVLLPKGGTLKECDSIVRLLRHENTTHWLNTRICCRHLTTKLMRRLPLWDEHE